MITQPLRSLVVLWIISLLLSACNNQQSTPEDSRQNLDELEAKAFSSSTELDVELGEELLRAYRYELKNNIDPEMLFKAGEVAYNLPGHEDEAMEFLQRLSLKFPKHERTPYALFYRGLIYDNRWNDKDKSAEVWEEFLVKYPSHKLANDAAQLLTLSRDTADDLQKVLRWKQESEAQSDIQ